MAKKLFSRRRLSTLMEPIELTQRDSMNTADPNGQTFQELLGMVKEIEEELYLMMSEYRNTVDGASEVIQSGKVSASLDAMGSVEVFRVHLKMLRRFKNALRT